MLQDNISFCILDYQQDWRTELTRSSVDFYRQQYGGKLYTTNIVGDAIRKCRTKYLLVIRSGGVVLSDRFFQLADDLLKRSQDIILGDIELGYDYAFLHDEVLLVNVALWKKHDAIDFSARALASPDIVSSAEVYSDHHPVSIKFGQQTTIVDSYCLDRGARLLMTQIGIFGEARSLSKALRAEVFHFGNSTLYEELLNETRFETEVFPRHFDRIHAFTRMPAGLPAVSIDTAIVPASGLYTLEVVRHVGAKNVIVYSSSEAQLNLQKCIFGISRSTNYENILAPFKMRNTSYDIDGDPKDGRSIIMHPPLLSVEYVKINPIGYQMEQLIKMPDRKVSLLLDVGDFYTDPLIGYKRAKGTIPAFFQMLHSKFASRPGPSFLRGLDPNFNSFDFVQVNNHRWKYERVEEVIEQDDDDGDGC